MTNRERRAAMAAETLAIIDAGHYTSAQGRRVDIASAVRACTSNTRLLLPDDLGRPESLASRRPASDSTSFGVANEGSLAAARALSARDFARIGVLNFASARNPGGGFLSGSQAQEESLARSSALYASLTSAIAAAFYTHHREEKSALYTDRLIVSPDCPVFRDDEGRLLDVPYSPTFFTCAAPNAGALSDRDDASARVPAVFARRAARFLAAALDARCDALVLGAWGCGVFRNDPAMVAGIFRELLADGGEFAGRFAHVRFAVLDSTPARECLRAFEHAFGGAASSSRAAQ
jgi:uncharacterized protein (TIGR02452 family)